MAKEPFAARLTCLWIGAFFYWVLHGFRGGLRRQINSKYDNRNMWTGYIIMLIIVGIWVKIVLIDHLGGSSR